MNIFDLTMVVPYQLDCNLKSEIPQNYLRTLAVFPSKLIENNDMVNIES